MSVWQTPQAARRTRTSPACGSARSTSCTASGAANSSRTAARMRMARHTAARMRDAPSILARLPEQYFTRILAAAAEARAKPGPRFIDLGRGNPDLPPPPRALDAMRAADDHGYAPFQGDPALREAIAARYAADDGVELDPEREVAVIPGTKTGIMFAALAAATRGDTILLSDPGYPDYLSGVALTSAVMKPLPLDASAGFQPDFDAVAGERPALVMLNYPSNPCSVCEHEGTFERAAAYARERDAWLVHDLAYGFLAFDGRRARSILEVDRERSAELWSPSKVYGMAGWRVGFLVGAAELVARGRNPVAHTTAGVDVGLQRGLAAALGGDQADVAERRAVYERRRDTLVERLRAAGADIATPEGTFYAWW